MDAALRALISAIHAAGHRCVLAATGGGATAAAWLLSMPGASRSILETIVPYDESSLAEFLGHRPASFCSLETARAMARRALDRARWLAPAEPIAGVGCTASLRSDRPKHGAHRFHLAIQTIQRIYTHSLILTKEARTRQEEETVLDLVLLNALAEALHLAERVDVPLLPGETLERQTHPPDDALTALWEGRVAALCVEGDGRLSTNAAPPKLLLSGSFNPLHAGHRTLAEAATAWTGFTAAFELTLVNADKPPLAVEEVRRRLISFVWQAPLWLTRAATFLDKAELFPGVVFIVGADTAERIVQPRFYGGSAEQLDAALNRVRQYGCRFLVAGRVGINGDFVTLDNLNIPERHRDLFTALPADRFRIDLCSTQLRAVSL
jgi:nicotinamide mononucleotide (NMN) deamidase PncC